MNRGPGCHMPEPGRARSAEPPLAPDLPKCPDIPFLTTRFNLSASRGQVNVSVQRGFDVSSFVRVLFVGFFGFLFDCFVVGRGLRGAGYAGWGLVALRWHLRFVVVAGPVWFACVFAGIRDLPSCFKRCPCAGRHLLFFAAAKKSRQKKAAHTANPCSCLRTPNGSYASHGSISVCVRCQRFE
jgi:hypothetical protein